TALKLLDDQRPDLAVLDVDLGAWSGFDLLTDIRRGSTIPVIMLTGHDREDDKVRGLDLGADDYLAKPFSHRDLIARIRAQLTRQGQEWSTPKPAATRIQVGPLTLNLAEHTAEISGT